MWNEFIQQLLAVWNTIQYDLINASFGLVLLMFSMLLNQLAGVILSLIHVEFNWKKLLKSIVKSIAVAIVVLGVCIILDLIPILLERTKLITSESIISQLITIIEIFAMLVIALIKYLKDIYEKLLCLFNVKKEEVDEAVQTTFNEDASVMNYEVIVDDGELHS